MHFRLVTDWWCILIPISSENYITDKHYLDYYKLSPEINEFLKRFLPNGEDSSLEPKVNPIHSSNPQIHLRKERRRNKPRVRT
jgi:hypothetical protein